MAKDTGGHGSEKRDARMSVIGKYFHQGSGKHLSQAKRTSAPTASFKPMGGKASAHLGKMKP